MRVFAVSDIHADYPQNAAWLSDLSRQDYRQDVLILAGDVSDSLSLLGRTLTGLAERFAKVIYVPGNHELWVIRDVKAMTSFDKFDKVRALAEECGVSTTPLHSTPLSIVPLFGWYDYSFGEPGADLTEQWTDYFACSWPAQHGAREITSRFLAMNEPLPAPRGRIVITFSHFLPRIDLMPERIPQRHRYLYPVLGTALLERQLRQVGATIHVYGHSHVNRRLVVDGVTYINNAFGYPGEASIAAKRLLCIFEDGGPASGLETHARHAAEHRHSL
ncbi:MAG TPA: metallophosphoesterase [Reyranella sp.]|jgi:predicted phosphodiesterase|nr:metallophosphoesterase [Reyranella sp.]